MVLVSDGKIRFFGCVMVMLASCCCWLNKLFQDCGILCFRVH